MATLISNGNVEIIQKEEVVCSGGKKEVVVHQQQTTSVPADSLASFKEGSSNNDVKSGGGVIQKEEEEEENTIRMVGDDELTTADAAFSRIREENVSGRAECEKKELIDYQLEDNSRCSSSGGSLLSSDIVVIKCKQFSTPSSSALQSTTTETTTDVSQHVPRRMYSTSFKLTVLDAYRQDEEVKGNQRATARKFGIHRRQIQKWLQIENVLRNNAMISTTNNNNEEEIDVVNDDQQPMALNLCIKREIKREDGRYSPYHFPIHHKKRLRIIEEQMAAAERRLEQEKERQEIQERLAKEVVVMVPEYNRDMILERRAMRNDILVVPERRNILESSGLLISQHHQQQQQQQRSVVVLERPLHQRLSPVLEHHDFIPTPSVLEQRQYPEVSSTHLLESAEHKLRLQMLAEADERNRWLLHQHQHQQVELEAINNNNNKVVQQPPSSSSEDLMHQQTPSPSTSSVSGKRRSFTLQFKLDVLNAFYSNEACKGNQRATARLYGINRRQVQKWLCQEAQLRGEATLSTPGEVETASTKRQRLGRWLWTVPQWTVAHWNDQPQLEQQHPRPPAVPSPLSYVPPQDTALCLVKEVKREITPTPSTPTPPPPSPPLEECEPISLVCESTKPKRHSYPLDFKIQALNAYHDDLDCKGNQRAVAKRFSIHRRQIQKWLKQEEQLRQRSVMGPTSIGTTTAAPRRETTNKRDSSGIIRGHLHPTVVVRNTPTVLKPMQVLSQQSAFTWMEEMRTPAPCWS